MAVSVRTVNVHKENHSAELGLVQTFPGRTGVLYPPALVFESTTEIDEFINVLRHAQKILTNNPY